MATITSNGTGGGVWSAGASWAGGVAPAAADTAVIASTDTVTFDRNDATETCRAITINGTLLHSTTATTNMIIGNASTTALVTFATTGIWRIGTSGTPIPAAYTATVNLDPSASGTGSITLAAGAKFEGYGAPLYNANTATINGETTANYDTTLASDVAIGATSLVFTTDIGLRAGGGDTITLGTNTNAGSPAVQDEICVVSAYNSSTKTATVGALTFAHKANARIANMTRNVTIKSVSSARRAGVNAAFTNTGGYITNWKHVAFVEFNGFSSAAPTGIGANMNTVGCSVLNNTAVQVIVWGQAVASTFTNTFIYKSIFSTASTGPAYIYHCGIMGTIVGVSTPSKMTMTDTWCTGNVLVSSGNNVTLNNCAVENSAFAITGTGLKANSCRFYNLTWVSNTLISSTFRNCTFITCGYMGYIGTNFDNVVIGGAYTSSFTTDMAMDFGANNILQSFAREFREQDTPLGNRTTFSYGLNTRQDSSTADSGVFPLPSQGSYVSQINNLQSNLVSSSGLPIVITYNVPLISGQTFDFTVNIMGKAWSSFPTNSQVYISATEPGSATAVVSTEVMTANSVWTPLRAQVTATATGFATCQVIIKAYEAGAGRKIYVDWPLYLSTAGMIWAGGIPNENLNTLTAGIAADVWAVVAANYASSTGTMGKQAYDTATKVDDNQALIIAK